MMHQVQQSIERRGEGYVPQTHENHADNYGQ